MSHSDTRTPPLIVAAADRPESALTAFIAQELEHWGFEIVDIKPGGVLVKADGRELMIGVALV